MSGVSKDWLFVAAFFIGFFVFTAAETFWLSRNTGHGAGKAFAFSFATNIFTVCVGFSVSFVIFGVILATAWDGSLERTPGGNATIWAAAIAGALFPLLLLIIAKRFMMRLMKMTGVTRPWAYSAAASLLFFAFAFTPPFLLGYLF